MRCITATRHRLWICVKKRFGDLAWAAETVPVGWVSVTEGKNAVASRCPTACRSTSRSSPPMSTAIWPTQSATHARQCRSTAARRGRPSFELHRSTAGRTGTGSLCTDTPTPRASPAARRPTHSRPHSNRTPKLRHDLASKRSRCHRRPSGGPATQIALARVRQTREVAVRRRCLSWPGGGDG